MYYSYVTMNYKFSKINFRFRDVFVLLCIHNEKNTKNKIRFFLTCRSALLRILTQNLFCIRLQFIYSEYIFVWNSHFNHGIWKVWAKKWSHVNSAFLLGFQPINYTRFNIFRIIWLQSIQYCLQNGLVPFHTIQYVIDINSKHTNNEYSEYKSSLTAMQTYCLNSSELTTLDKPENGLTNLKMTNIVTIHYSVS